MKNGMKESVSPIILLIAGIVIACLVVSFGFLVYNTQKETGNQVLTKTNETNTAMLESEYTQYNGTIITGAEVLNLIKQNEGNEICIEVSMTANATSGTPYVCSSRTDLTPVDQTTFNTAIKAAKKKGSATYINPNSKFMGAVYRDDTTDVINAIVFAKQ